MCLGCVINCAPFNNAPNIWRSFSQAQELTREFQDVILEKQEELKELEVQINAALCDLDGQLANILQPSSDSK